MASVLAYEVLPVIPWYCYILTEDVQTVHSVGGLHL
jgi:hypothetical protein